MKRRLAVLTNELPPYRRPIFEMLAEEDLEVVALLNVAAEAGRHWGPATSAGGVDVRIVKSLSFRFHHRHGTSVRREKTLHVPIGLGRALKEARPDAILSGEFGPRSLVAARFARRHRIPLILWSEETEAGSRSANRIQRSIRKRLLERADAFVGWGKPACDFLLRQGIPSEKVFRCAQAIDNDYWSELYLEASERPPALPDAGVLFLTVGRLMQQKGLDVLLRAWAKSSLAADVGTTLAFAGSGEIEGELRELAKELKLTNVLFLGNQTPEQLASLYARAHATVFPTWLDAWGMVVNESMICGAPVLCSRGAGACEEMIEPGLTGDAFEPGDVVALSGLLEKWRTRAPGPPLPACIDRAREQSFSATVHGILGALQYAFGLPERA